MQLSVPADTEHWWNTQFYTIVYGSLKAVRHPINRWLLVVRLIICLRSAGGRTTPLESSHCRQTRRNYWLGIFYMIGNIWQSLTMSRFHEWRIKRDTPSRTNFDSIQALLPSRMYLSADNLNESEKAKRFVYTWCPVLNDHTNNTSTPPDIRNRSGTLAKEKVKEKQNT